MKAKIKKTGELVNIAPYAKITLESCDSWGNPIEVSPEEIELVHDDVDANTTPDHWQDVRERAAIAVLPQCLKTVQDVLLRGGSLIEDTIAKQAAVNAVEYADALVKKLKGE